MQRYLINFGHKLTSSASNQSVGLKTSEESRAYGRAWYAKNKQRRNTQKRKQYQREYYHRRRAQGTHKPPTKEMRRDKMLWWHYGLTRAQFDSILDSQAGVCAICNNPDGSNPSSYNGENFVVDHDHATGRIRGLLCTKCNSGLGMFNDKAEVLSSAIDYLTGPGTPFIKPNRRQRTNGVD